MRDLLERKILFFAQDKRWRRIDLVTQDPPLSSCYCFLSPTSRISAWDQGGGGGISNVPPPTYKVLQPKSGGGGGMSKETSPSSLSQCVPIQARISPSSLLSPNCPRWWSRFFGQKRPSPRCIQGISPLYRCFEAVPPPSAATSMGKTFLSSSSSSGGACNKISPPANQGRNGKPTSLLFSFPIPPPTHRRLR